MWGLTEARRLAFKRCLRKVSGMGLRCHACIPYLGTGVQGLGPFLFTSTLSSSRWKFGCVGPCHPWEARTKFLKPGFSLASATCRQRISRALCLSNKNKYFIFQKKRKGSWGMKSRPQWEGSQSQIGGLLGECPVLTPALLGADVSMLCGMLRAVSYTSVLLGDSCKPSFPPS